MDYREDADIRNDNYQARGIIFKGDMLLVMFRKKNGKEYYTFPGGHMRNYEKPIDTAIREIEEETTIRVNNLKPAYEFINHIDPEEREYYFVGDWESGEPTLSGEESRRQSDYNYYEPMWVDINNLESINLLPLTAKEWILYHFPKFKR